VLGAWLVETRCEVLEREGRPRGSSSVMNLCSILMVSVMILRT
jgi:hypothetical protein